MEDYLEHSKKGTSWAKKGAKYISRIKKNGKWVYTYKLRKAKDVVKKAAVNVKEDQEMRERVKNAKARDKKTKKLRSKKYKAVNTVRGAVNTYKAYKHEKDMKNYSQQQVKKHKEMLHTMSNGYSYLIHSMDEAPAKSENYLIHSKGPWKDHKYTAKKTGKSGKPIYIYSEYKQGDKDFDYEGEEWHKNFKRVGDTDGFMKTNPDGTITIVEEDMKWTLPKGSKVDDDTVNALLDRNRNDSRKYRAKEYQKETAQNKKREQAARTISRSEFEKEKARHDVAKAYEEQKQQKERYQNALDDVARAYNDQEKKEKKIAHGADTEGYSYLIHSAKGSSWSKKDHKYIRKYKSKDGRWVYVYRINKDKNIKLESSSSDSKTEELLDDYAARLKTMDINSDGTYLKNGERRIIQGKPSPIFDDGTRMVWTSKTNKIDSSYKDVVNDKEKLKKEITGNPSTGLFQNVNAPTKFELNDEMRRDNQKALAKGIKKFKNKK